MSNLRDHAERELKLSGVDEDIYGDMTSKAVLELIDTFSNQGHSGASGSLVLQLFNRLVNFENLTPLTDNPDEWLNRHEYDPTAPPMWQSTRNSEAFSYDGGKTYWLLSEHAPGTPVELTVKHESVKHGE